MAYSLSWGSNHPGFLVYLIDLSGSMSTNSRIEYVSETVTKVSEYLVGMCENGELQNRFDIRIIGYNSDVIDLFSGSVIDLDNKLEEAFNKKVSLFGTFDGKAEPNWQTYTAKGFRAAADQVLTWINQQQSKNIPIPAPVVIHLTDGHPEESGRSEAEATADALKAANEIKSISVPDGNVLLFNIHIDEVEGNSLRLPSQRPTGSDVKSSRLQFLFDASSIMTDVFVNRANAFKLDAEQGSRFMVSNESDKDLLARLIAFGSSVTSVGGSFVEMPKYQ